MRRHGLDAKKLMMLMGGGPAPFVDPTSVSGLLLWCAADQLTLNDGDAVASFTDLSGNNNHPACANAANKPTFKTNILNSLPAILFSGDMDANGDWLRVGFNRAIPQTVFVVFQILTLRTSSMVLSGYSDPGILQVGAGTASSNAIIVSSGASLLYLNAGTTDFAIWTVEYNGASSNIYKAGAVVSSGNTGTSSQNGITIGASPYFALYGAGSSRENGNAHMYLAELIIYNKVLSASERSNVGEFLSGKYGLNF